MRINSSLIIKYIFIITLFVSNTIYSQSLEKIKLSDTVYVYFKKDRTIIYNQQKPLDNYIYTFTYLSKNHIYQTIWFQHDDNRFNQIIIKRRKFIKENKDIMVSYPFLKKFNYREATKLFDNKKVFLIDKDDIGCFKIKLKEVQVSGFYEQSIE
ncbi:MULTISPECIES: hypothetical protein [unclassified Flavobacterium]|uniref:hypothetical protein n=1 Tax=unclassified Flavobacterium TaxID=196869 RepID=UPI003F9381BB